MDLRLYPMDVQHCPLIIESCKINSLYLFISYANNLLLFRISFISILEHLSPLKVPTTKVVNFSKRLTDINFYKVSFVSTVQATMTWANFMQLS